MIYWPPQRESCQIFYTTVRKFSEMSQWFNYYSSSSDDGVPEATGEGESGCLGGFLVDLGVDKAWELVPI